MKLLAIAFTALILSACSSLKVSSDYNPEVDFSSLKTYAWIEKKTDDGSYNLDGLMDQRIKNAVNNGLQAKGFTLTDPDVADVLVNYVTKIDKKINVDTFTTNYGYNPYWGRSALGFETSTQTMVREYKVGTLMLDMVDSASGLLIWRGSAAETIRDKDTPQKRIDAVNKAIDALLVNYPPKITSNE